MIQPPYLKKGNTIGITCPAGFMDAARAQTCIETLQQWGFEVMVGKTLGSASTNYFSGTDEERRDELQAMLDDQDIHAILFGRGGYGMSRIIDGLDFKQFKKHPKWLIGFSDITVMHCHLATRLKTASIHAPMAAAFNDGGSMNEYVQSLKKMMLGKKNNYTCPANPLNRTGKASGELTGGNLTLFANMIGTASEPYTNNKVLFLEDIGEYIYSSDRLMMQLKRAGKLDKLAGLIIGGFTDMKDTERPFGKTIYESIHELVKDYNYPVCFGFPVSHEKENYALKVGGNYELNITRNQTRLKEI